MIVYLDTSAFVKLYLDEEGSTSTRRLVAAAAAERVWRQAPEHFQLAAFDARLVSAAHALEMAALEHNQPRP